MLFVLVARAIFPFVIYKPGPKRVGALSKMIGYEKNCIQIVENFQDNVP